MYPVQSLIYRTLNTDSKYAARKILAEKLGNKSRNKAFSMADRFLEWPVISVEYAIRLHEALGLPKEIVLDAARDAYLQAEEEHRLAYLNAMGPHLAIETQGPISSPVFACLSYNRLKVLRLPKGIAHESMDKQLRCAREAIERHVAEFGYKLPIFGEILGFIYKQDTENCYELDKQGSLLRKLPGKPDAPNFSVGIGGRRYDWSTIPSFIQAP
ncbi:hypothetical protein L1F30_16025 [Simiduia sp. 21SJ11W-1]|uniref:hypothetical protein n=1 Tax=Simiduia sp. 21SJ11W-1 TaxID=2909669 RepID=UPI0020A0B123|nr:hypothetical protein [Simiduia sp. 21SJ11W-1]UTA47649.1 hypothetical protein L1F30_16025 [Simiduia sp. 21SJ11W-1]